MIAEPGGSPDAGNVCGVDAVWFVAAQVTLAVGQMEGTQEPSHDRPKLARHDWFLNG